MVNIHFGKLQVDTVSRSSGIFSGRNHQFGWQSTMKQNQGFGQINGRDNKMSDHIHTVVNPEQEHKED